MNIIKMSFLFLVCTFFLTGCWDKVEIDDRNYVITMGIDKFEEGDFPSEENENRFTISLGTATLEQTSGGGENGGKEEEDKGGKTISGQTLASAMKLADLYSSRQTYYGQMKAVIFGKEILEDRKLFREALDTLERDQEINMKIIILGTEGKAADCVTAISGEKQPTGLFLWEFYKNNSHEVSATKKLDFESLLVSLRGNGTAVIPLVGVQDKKLDLGGSILFKEESYAGILNEQQEEGILLAEGNAEGAILHITYKNTPIPLRIIKNTSKVTFDSNDENIICNIDIKVKGNIEGFSLKEDNIFSKERMEEIAPLFESSISRQVKESITLMQKDYQVDGMNFIGMLEKKSYSLYKKYAGRKETLFRNMEFQIQTEVNIDGIGMIQ